MFGIKSSTQNSQTNTPPDTTKPLKQKQSRAKKKKDDSNSFYAISYRMLNKRISFLYPRYSQLEGKIAKAAMTVPYEVYLSATVMASLIAVLVGGLAGLLISLLVNIPIPIIGYVLPFLTSIAAGIVVFFFLQLYPDINIMTRKGKISAELPYFIGYMATLAVSGLTLEQIFKAAANEDSKEELILDARYLIRDIDIFGFDIISALKNLIKRSPLPAYSDFLDGVITTVQAGGDLREFFLASSEVQLEEKKIAIQKSTSSIGMLAEMYTMLLVVFPLIAVTMMAIMSIMSQSLGGFSLPLLMNLMTYAFVPICGLMMLVMIDSSIPKK